MPTVKADPILLLRQSCSAPKVVAEEVLLRGLQGAPLPAPDEQVLQLTPPMLQPYAVGVPDQHHRPTSTVAPTILTAEQWVNYQN